MFTSISMDEFLTLNDSNIIDVRERDEYESGHIPNSTLIPMSECVSRVEELDSNKTYYLICHSGSRSYQVCRYAATQGKKVVNVLGGMGAYRGVLDYEM